MTAVSSPRQTRDTAASAGTAGSGHAGRDGPEDGSGPKSSYNLLIKQIESLLFLVIIYEIQAGSTLTVLCDGYIFFLSGPGKRAKTVLYDF